MYRLGPVMQLAYLVDDLDAAARHWAQFAGCGPFFALRHLTFQTCLYRGAPCTADISVGIAYSGDIQIELIQQHNDAPSIYRDFAQRGNSQGGHHVGVLSADIDADLAHLKAMGHEPVQWGDMPNGMRFAYVESPAHPGAMVELIGATPGVTAFFGQMRDVARNWDGKDAIIETG